MNTKFNHYLKTVTPKNVASKLYDITFNRGFEDDLTCDAIGYAMDMTGVYPFEYAQELLDARELEGELTTQEYNKASKNLAKCGINLAVVESDNNTFAPATFEDFRGFVDYVNFYSERNQFTY